jgi:hypothetical protein
MANKQHPAQLRCGHRRDRRFAVEWNGRSVNDVWSQVKSCHSDQLHSDAFPTLRLR